jgi:hypothetical protein
MRSRPTSGVHVEGYKMRYVKLTVLLGLLGVFLAQTLPLRHALATPSTGLNYTRVTKPGERHAGSCHTNCYRGLGGSQHCDTYCF